MRKRLSEGERRAEIQEAATKIFLKKGFVNTTMEDVIGETTMSKGGVYHYYKNTIDILHDLMVEGIKYRNEIIKSYLEDFRQEYEVEFIARRFVEKIIDDNPYMEVYVQFLTEKKRNKKLGLLFDELKEQTRKDISMMYKETPKYFLNNRDYDLITDFTNSMIMGANILEARENFTKNRDILEKMVCLLFKELGE